MSAGGGGGRRQQEHPGGTGAVLGVRLLRYSGVQGASLLLSNVIQLIAIAVVANFLGPAELGRYALLLFLAGLTTQILSLACKPGTIRRVFGGGDDEDEDDDEEEDKDVSASPQRALGSGLAWAAVLGALGGGLIVLLRRPLADLLLGDAGEEGLIVWAGVLAGFWLVFKVAAITIWLERRPTAFLITDAMRPLAGLVALTALLAGGAGVDGAIAGTAAGTGLAAIFALFVLRGSFEPSFDRTEVVEIVKLGRRRVPIVMSFWLVQNADIFLLSRFVDDGDLGIYALASRLGFVVSFLPQGFRMAQRPLRKSAAFQAVQDEYGKQVQRGQLLGYFTLLCIFAVLMMVVGGEIVVGIAPDSYADAASLVPLTAAAMVMPALYRTVNQNATVRNKRRYFIGGCVLAVVLMVGITVALAPEIGVYAAPIGILVGFGVPSAYLFLRSQLGPKPIDFPYREVLTAVLLAAAIAGAFVVLPEFNAFGEAAVALALLVAYLGLLVVFRVIPEQHWQPLAHMARSAVRGTTVTDFNPRVGLRKLPGPERRALRIAVKRGLPADELRTPEGEAIVGSLRRVGNRAGVPGIAKPGEFDAEIAVFLFERAPTAVHNASMRRLLAAGAPSNELRALEELAGHLARVPKEAWKRRRKQTPPG